ncbi:MAG: glycosyltransferase [Arenicellales bacterium]
MSGRSEPLGARWASIVVTTYGHETRYTQMCLQRIGEWKSPREQLIVVYHDASPLLRAYLEFLAAAGVIDVLLRAESGHGHARGVNLGFRHTDAPCVFNISIDVMIGPGVVDGCVQRMQNDPRLGAIGWHYEWGSGHTGSHWKGAELEYAVRPSERDMDCRVGDELKEDYAMAVESAPWFTGRVFAAVGRKRLLFFNSSVFGIRRTLWNVLGGFDESRFPHYWAEDLLCYGILDQGYGIGNLPAHLGDGGKPDLFRQTSELKWERIDDPDRRRDELNWSPRVTHPGLTVKELVLLDLLTSRPGCRVGGLDVDPAPRRHGEEIGRPITGAAGNGLYDVVIAGPTADGATRAWRDCTRLVKEDGVLVLLPPAPRSPDLQSCGRLAVWFADRRCNAFLRENR